MDHPAPLHIHRVVGIFARHDLSWRATPQGELITDYASSDGGPVVRIIWAAEGPTRTILAVTAALYGITYDSTQRLQLLERANTWNATFAYPRAVIVPDTTRSARIIADHHIDLNAGIDDGGLDRLVTTTIAATLGYFTWLDHHHPHASHHHPPAPGPTAGVATWRPPGGNHRPRRRHHHAGSPTLRTL